MTRFSFFTSLFTFLVVLTLVSCKKDFFSDTASSAAASDRNGGDSTAVEDGATVNHFPVLTSFEEILASSSTVVENFIGTSAYIDFLSQNSFSASVFYRLQADSLYEFYGVKLLKSGESSGKEYYLVLYIDSTEHVTNSVLIEQEVFSGHASISLFRMVDYTNIASQIIVFGGGGSTIVEKKPCRETTNNFNSCMSCSLDDLTSDWIGLAACMTNPWMCIGAAAFHCRSFM